MPKLDSPLSISDLEPRTNLLTPLTPIFAGWTQNPGTLADLTNELDNSLTTPGIEHVSDPVSILYDLGAPKRILVHGLSSATSGGSNLIIQGSLNGTDFFFITQITFGEDATFAQGQGAAVARWIKIINDHPGAITYTVFGLRVYAI